MTRHLDNEIVRTTLRPASALYAMLSRSRNLLYDRGFVAVRKLPVPVISVGNITVGGTGKTPLTIHLARRLLEAGIQPLILSRGYGSNGTGTRIVSDEHSVLLGAERAGDEPVLMASRVPGVPVVVDPDRVRGGLTGIRRFRPDAILLDDGFQHRRLARQLDIVLLDAVDPFGHYAMLPAGRLREPFPGLARAGMFVITHAPDGEGLGTMLAVLRRYNSAAPIVKAAHVAHSLIRLDALGAMGAGPRTRDHPDQAGSFPELDPPPAMPLAALRDTRVFGFCGVGNPDGFRTTLRGAGAQIAEFASFRDHHRYHEAEVRALVSRAEACGAEMIVTTEKDAVRLAGMPQADRIMALRIEMHIDDESVLMGAVMNVVRR